MNITTPTPILTTHKHNREFCASRDVCWTNDIEVQARQRDECKNTTSTMTDVELLTIFALRDISGRGRSDKKRLQSLQNLGWELCERVSRLLEAWMSVSCRIERFVVGLDNTRQSQTKVSDTARPQ